MPDYTGVFLPKSLRPIEYTLDVRPNIYTGNPGNFSFDGYVKIDMICDSLTQNITLHCKDLTINDDSISLQDSNGRNIALEHTEINTEMEFLVVYVNETLVPTMMYVLEVRFSGPLLPDMAGLYYTSYQRGNDTM